MSETFPSRMATSTRELNSAVMLAALQDEIAPLSGGSCARDL